VVSIDAFLDNDKTYQDFKKNIFIGKLKNAFLQFSNFGDTRLFSIEGNCNICDKSKTGFTFIGNNSHNYMSIIFDTVDGKVKDLYECSNFKTQQDNLNLKERVFIDDELFSPF